MLDYIEKMKLDMELRGMSTQTKDGYIKRVQVFLRFVDKNVIDISDIRNFVIYLKDTKKLSFGTINAYISALKFLFCVTLEKDWDSRKVPRMRGYKSIPAVLSKSEVFEIINSVKNLKHKAILMTMYGSGLRVSEVSKLKVSDIDSKNFQILVRQSKNKSDRYAILSQKSLDILRIYWAECGKPHDWLFPGINKENHINVKTIKNLVLKIKKKLNITKNISAHAFRHSFATHLLESNVPLPYIQQLLGHKSLKSTIIYLHMTSKAMMNIKSPLDEGVDLDG
jgi:integrase/recombinase XerD